jgi:hypothetical protein
MRTRNGTDRRALSMSPINTRTNHHIIITTRTVMSIFRLKFFRQIHTDSRYVSRVALATLAALAGSAAPALAAAPEQPVTEPTTGVTTTTATLHGVLNPAASAKVHWSFAYSPEEFGPQCIDAFRTTDEEAEGEALPETMNLTELEAHRKYRACLTASNEEGETLGNEVTFETAPAPPNIDGESVLATPVGATLEAQVNPNNEKTSYFFEYSTSEAEVLAGKGTKVSGAAELEGGSDQAASVPTGSVLAPGTTYFYRVIAENEQSTKELKPVDGSVKEFTTVPSPFTEAVTEITATSATFNGTVAPLSSADTTYAFDYKLLSNGPECTGENTTSSQDAGTGTGTKAVSTKTGEQAIELQPSATYSVCLVSSNAFGSAVAAPVSFTTEPAPPKIDSQTSYLTPSGITLEAQVNPNNQETKYAFEYATSPALLAEVKLAPGTTTLAGPGGQKFGDQPASAVLQSVLQPATTYYYRATAENGAGPTVDSTIESFTTPPAPPLTVGQAQNVTRTTATLPGSVNPEGLETSYHYEYGTTMLYGGNAPSLQGVNAGAGSAAVPTSIGIGGLVPATTYHYRLVATNTDGTTYSPDKTFTTAPPTPPTVSTGEASNITLTTATVAGTINPEGLETSYELDLGIDTTYGTSVYGEVGSAGTPTQVTVSLQNLAPGSTYHYRLVAINSDGRIPGADRTFTTPAYNNPIVQPFTLPLLATPAIAFPTETKSTAKPTVKKHAKPKHKKPKHKKKPRHKKPKRESRRKK